MPDISMCASDMICPKASTCRRSEKSGTKPSMWQSYSDFAPKDKPVDMCDYYYPKYDVLNSNGTIL